MVFFNPKVECQIIGQNKPFKNVHLDRYLANMKESSKLKRETFFDEFYKKIANSYFEESR